MVVPVNVISGVIVMQE